MTPLSAANIEMMPGPGMTNVTALDDAREKAQTDAWFMRIKAAEADQEAWLKACKKVLPLYRGVHKVSDSLEEGWATRVTVPLLKSVHDAKMPWLHASLPRYEPSSNPLMQVAHKIIMLAWGVNDVFRQTELAVNEAQQINVSCCFVGWDANRRLPTVKYWPAEDLLVDPDCRNEISEARWIALREILPLDVVRANPNYRFDRQPLESYHYQASPTTDRGKESQRMAHAKIVTLYHVWTKDGVPPVQDSLEESEPTDVTPMRLITLAENHPYALRNVPWPFLLSPGEFPIEILKYRDYVSVGDDRMTFWGAPSGQAVQRLLYGIDWAATFILEHGRSSAAVKHLLKGEGWTDEKIQQFLSNKDGEAILADENMRAELIQISQSFPALSELLQWGLQLFDQIEGFDQIVRGGQQRVQTATEAGIRGEHAQSRLERDARITQDFVQKLARKALKVARLYVTAEDVARYLGPEAAQLWQMHAQQYGGDFQALVNSLDTELILNVEANSIRFKDAAVEIQKADKTIQLWLPFYQQEGYFEVIPALIDYWHKANQIPGYQAWMPPQEAIQRSLMMRMMPSLPPPEAQNAPSQEETAQ